MILRQGIQRRLQQHVGVERAFFQKIHHLELAEAGAHAFVAWVRAELDQPHGVGEVIRAQHLHELRTLVVPGIPQHQAPVHNRDIEIAGLEQALGLDQRAGGMNRSGDRLQNLADIPLPHRVIFQD